MSSPRLSHYTFLIRDVSRTLVNSSELQEYWQVDRVYTSRKCDLQGASGLLMLHCLSTSHWILNLHEICANSFWRVNPLKVMDIIYVFLYIYLSIYSIYLFFIHFFFSLSAIAVCVCGINSSTNTCWQSFCLKSFILSPSYLLRLLFLTIFSPSTSHCASSRALHPFLLSLMKLPSLSIHYFRSYLWHWAPSFGFPVPLFVLNWLLLFPTFFPSPQPLLPPMTPYPPYLSASSPFLPLASLSLPYLSRSCRSLRLQHDRWEWWW